MLQTGLFLQEKVSSCMKFAKISENSNRNFGKRKPLKRSNFKGFGWRSRWDSNPRGREAKRFSRPPRYDRFDTAPCPRIISKRKATFNIFGLYYRESALPFTVEILYRRLTYLSASRSTDTAGCDRDPCVSS